MKATTLFLAILILSGILFLPKISAENIQQQYNTLNKKERQVILYKGTEYPGTGKYDKFYETGTYVCKQCDLPLFNSDSKFNSGTGWPSFDEAIQGNVKTTPDGNRTEIVCARCGGHLGHLFCDEGFTEKGKRHCVNSISLRFVPKNGFAKAYFAGGCFWGVEYWLEKLPGVSEVISGFMGGDVANPSYKEVVRGKTGHVETVEVLYDPSVISYSELAQRFFEIHDPTQENGQGPDIGPQYLSKVFVSNATEREDVNTLIDRLKKRYGTIATQVEPTKTFYPAEEYHQNYYEVHKKKPYCHTPVKRFNDQ